MDDTPRIYVASLSDYNAGRLHGEWVDATQDPEDILADIQEMLRASPSNRRRGVQVAVPRPKQVAEEWAIHDFENFAGLQLNEHESLADISRAAQFIEEYGDRAGPVIEHVGGLSYLDEAEDLLDDKYMGSYEDLEEWAVQELEDLIEALPEQLRYYFDYKSFARDAEMSGEIFSIEAEGELHIFSNR